MRASVVKEQWKIQYALVTFLVLVALVAGVGLYRLGINEEDDRRDDLFRFYLTLIEVAGVGGVAALLLERYKQLTATAEPKRRLARREGWSEHLKPEACPLLA